MIRKSPELNRTKLREQSRKILNQRFEPSNGRNQKWFLPRRPLLRWRSAVAPGLKSSRALSVRALEARSGTPRARTCALALRARMPPDGSSCSFVRMPSLQACVFLPRQGTKPMRTSQPERRRACWDLQASTCPRVTALAHALLCASPASPLERA